MASPAAFGFLGKGSATIEVNGATLEFNAETRVSLTASDITVQDGAELSNPGGEILIAATGEEQSDVSVADNAVTGAGGNITMNSADMTASGDNSGHISIHAGNMDMNDATLAADNTGNLAANGGVDLTVNGTLTVADGSRVQSNVFGSADSGGIRIQADNMQIKQDGTQDFTGIFTEVEPEASGNAGTIDINVIETLQITGPGGITSCALGDGDAGFVQVSAGDLLMNGEGRSAPYRTFSGYIAGICSETIEDSGGNAGAVTITVENSLSMFNGCGIDSWASGSGNADNVTVHAGLMTIDGQGSEYFTGIASNAESGSQGKARSIEIDVQGCLNYSMALKF